jgi:hypothetical protein
MAHCLATSSASGAGAAGVGVLNGLSSLVGSGEVVVADGAAGWEVELVGEDPNGSAG